MSENNDRTAAGRLDASDLEARIDALERRARRDRTEPRDDGAEPARRRDELADLRRTVDDLAADVLDLHNQVATVVSACERLLAGAGASASLSGAGRSRMRSSASVLGRVARRIVRGTVGAARGVLRPTPAGVRVPEIEIDLASKPVRRAPSVALVVGVTDDPTGVEPPSELRGLIGDGVSVVIWDRSRAAAVAHTAAGRPERFDAPDRAALVRALGVDAVAEVGPSLPRVPTALVDLCRWTLASEGLPMRVSVTGRAVRPGDRWTLEPADSWARGTDRPAPLIKVVGGRGWDPMGEPDAPLVGAGNGRGYLPAPGSSGTLTHVVAPLSGVARLRPDERDRPAVLVLSPALGFGIVAGLVRALGESRRFVVVTTGGGAGVAVSDRALTELGAELYPLPAWLEPEVWPSLVADLIAANGIGTVMRLGRSVELALRGGDRPRVVDLPFDADQIDPASDAVLAVGAEIAGAARAAGLATTELLAAPDIAGALPDADRLTNVRSAYGVPDHATLVLAVADLVPDRRPEDVAAVAYRLRDRSDVHVLLVGHGPLVGTVSDIAGHFTLDRFTLSPPGHAVADLVAASDCVLSTAERDPWPEAVAAALALGRHVVATDIDGVRELVAAADGDRCVLCAPGDLDGLAAGVVETLDTHRKARVTKKAWHAARQRARQSVETFTEVLVGPGPDGGGRAG